MADSTNVVGSRAAAPAPVSPIDYKYLTRLGGDAVGELVAALAAPPIAPSGSPVREAEVRARCDAVRDVLTKWGSSATQSDWRLWNVGTWRAQRLVAHQEHRLRTVTCWDGGTEAAFGDRDRRPAQPNEQWFVAPAHQN
jgi:hypothetical protein